jgi:hypothetical protein
MRNTYWSCSKFANWVRGLDKPNIETWEGWKEWRETGKKNHPIRFWISEELLDMIQDVFYYPSDKFNQVRIYFLNRWIDKTNSLTANKKDIKPGQWCDLSERILYCLFNELQIFVEKELTREGAKGGLEYLNWASTLRYDDEWCKDKDYYNELTPQAKSSIEIKELYLWWTETYRNRPDPLDASGSMEYFRLSREANDSKDIFAEDSTEELKQMKEETHKRLNEIESQYDEEDTQMLIRLIKVRKSLWT